MDQVQKEINGFYAKYAKAEGITISEARKRVSEADIKAYERKAAKYVKDKDFSEEANAEMRLYNATMKINRLEMLKANIGLELVDGFNDLQKYFDKILTERTLDEFERQAGILGKTIHNNARMAYSIVNASFHNARFSDRIWMYQDMLKSELSKLLREGLIQGKNPKKLAGHLEKLFDSKKSDAERLMITELARVQGDAQLRSLKENGYEQYTFLALGSACDICKDIDGEHFYVDEAEIGVNMYPMHPNCRCAIAGYVDREEYEEKIDYLLNGGDRDEWERLKKKGTLGTGKSKRRGHTTKTILGDIDYGKALEAMIFFGEQIRNMKKEHAIVIDKDGRVSQFTGKEDSVDIFDVDLDGAYITHNHPESQGIVSFGEDDFNFLKEYPEIREFRCCNAEYDYTIRILKPLDDVVYNELYREALMRMSPDKEVQDVAIQILAERGYVQYDKKRLEP